MSKTTKARLRAAQHPTAANLQAVHDARQASVDAKVLKVLAGWHSITEVAQHAGIPFSRAQGSVNRLWAAGKLDNKWGVIRELYRAKMEVAS